MFYLNNIQLNIWAEFKDAIETEFYSNAGYAKPDLQLGRESTSCLISILLVCPLSNFSQLSIQAVRKVLQHHNLMCLFLLLLAGMSEQHSQQKKICATKFFFFLCRVPCWVIDGRRSARTRIFFAFLSFPPFSEEIYVLFLARFDLMI